MPDSPVPARPSSSLISRRTLLGGLGIAAIGGAVILPGSNALQVVKSAPAGGPGPSPIRVALITDVHAPNSWVAATELAHAVAAFDPHLLFVVGDSIDRGDEVRQVRMFDAIAARHGKFAVLGNHEHWSGCDMGELRREYERSGVRVLVNEEVSVDIDGRPVQVVGLDDWRAGTPDYRFVRDDHRPWRTAAHRFVLAHCPAGFDAVCAAASLPFDAVAGHTHGGQVAPFGRALFLPYGSGRYLKGWYRGPDPAQRLYVSRGVGNVGVPFRMGAPPELALLTF